MKKINLLILLSALWGINIQAQDLEIEVPNGWAATESGIAKGNSELSIGPVIELNGLSHAEYLSKLAKVESIEGYEISNVAEIKDGDHTASIQRDLVQGEDTARSIFFICKGGRNQDRLLELFTNSALNIISGGRAAISFCAQS